jgi:hypothetical protein
MRGGLTNVRACGIWSAAIRASASVTQVVAGMSGRCAAGTSCTSARAIPERGEMTPPHSPPPDVVKTLSTCGIAATTCSTAGTPGR